MCKVIVTVSGDLETPFLDEGEIEDLIDEFKQEFDYFFLNRATNVLVEVVVE